MEEANISVIALYGAIVATLSLFWQIIWQVYSYFQTGPQPKAEGMVVHSDQEPILKFIVQNEGRMPTTIRGIAIDVYETTWKWIFDKPLSEYWATTYPNQSTEFPKLLSPGEHWEHIISERTDTPFKSAMILGYTLYYGINKKLRRRIFVTPGLD